MKSPIPDDLDIHRTASISIAEYGEDTLIQAAQRHDELLDKGDMDGAIIWGRVVRVVREVLAQGGATVH